jgi:hypothetical protein
VKSDADPANSILKAYEKELKKQVAVSGKKPVERTLMQFQFDAIQIICNAQVAAGRKNDASRQEVALKTSNQSKMLAIFSSVAQLKTYRVH